MKNKSVTCLILSVFIAINNCYAQTDSSAEQLRNIPVRSLTQINNKIDKYNQRITAKTEKTLIKLCRYENKIQQLLQKVNPGAAQRLFNNNQYTFASLLQKVQQGQTVTGNVTAQYNGYNYQLSTGLKYLNSRKNGLDSELIKPVADADSRMDTLKKNLDNSEAVNQLIKQRKKQLTDECAKYMISSKYIQSINKEAWYYGETMKNYHQVFADPEKGEAALITAFNSIPAFRQFAQGNSRLASLFGMPAGYNNSADLQALQTRSDMESLVQNNISAGGPNAQQLITQHLQDAQNKLGDLKNKVLQSGADNNTDMPDFRPDMEKAKLFKQRLEYSSNIQFGKSNGYVPATTDLGLNVGYKLNDKSIIGVGAAYSMGLGSLDHISISSQGAALRSFLNWSVKKQFFVSGGMEMNYVVPPALANGKENDLWQQAALLGIGRKIPVKTKLAKGTQVQLLYDFLSGRHVPVSPPFLFRVGYTF